MRKQKRTQTEITFEFTEKEIKDLLLEALRRRQDFETSDDVHIEVRFNVDSYENFNGATITATHVDIEEDG